MSSHIFTLKNFRASDGNRTHNILINLTRYPSYSILIFINTCIYADSIFSNVSSIGPFVREKQKIKKFLFLSDEGSMLETLDFTIHLGSTPTFLYFDLYLYSAYVYVPGCCYGETGVHEWLNFSRCFTCGEEVVLTIVGKKLWNFHIRF